MHEKYKKIGIFFILLGIAFAVESRLRFHILYKFWPLVIISLAGGFAGIYIRRNRREFFFLAISVYLALFGLLALYLNFTAWNQLSFLWPLFIGFLGLSSLFVFILHSRNRMYLFLSLFMLSMSTIFFLVFYLSGQLWWLTFILLGFSILVTGRIK